MNANIINTQIFQLNNLTSKVTKVHPILALT